MGDGRTSPDGTDARAGAVDATARLTPAEITAVEAVRDASAAGEKGEVDGFAMAHERWGALREGVTGDLYSVISAYKELDEREEAATSRPNADSGADSGADAANADGEPVEQLEPVDPPPAHDRTAPGLT